MGAVMFGLNDRQDGADRRLHLRIGIHYSVIEEIQVVELLPGSLTRSPAADGCGDVRPQ